MSMRIGVGAVELDRDLALAVGPQPIDFVLAASFGQAIDDAVGERDRQRHQLVGVVAGVAEHQALVAGAVLARGIDAHRDVGALLVRGRPAPSSGRRRCPSRLRCSRRRG